MTVSRRARAGTDSRGRIATVSGNVRETSAQGAHILRRSGRVGSTTVAPHAPGDAHHLEIAGQMRPTSRVDLIISADGTLFIHELAHERAETFGLGDPVYVVHCVHSLDGHWDCSKGMPLCTDLPFPCPFAGTI